MKKIILIPIFALVLIPVFVFSQSVETTTPPPTTLNVKIENPFKGGSDLRTILVEVLEKIVMPIGAVVVVLAIIYSGFKFVMAQGDPKGIADANKGLLYVLIGSAVLLGAVGISKAIEGTLKQIVNF